MGVEGVPDHPAQFSACVGPALESAGFRDMDGSFSEDAANCLAHYEITLGTDPGMFSPSQIVPRWQMALFLARAGRPAGIVLPTASDQGFTDLNVGSDTQEAINQLAELGIMTGNSPTTFDPQGPVTRRQMAVLLARFLSIAPTGAGGANIDRISPDDDHFVDLSGVTFETRTAIRKIYELGVTTGTTESHLFAFRACEAGTYGSVHQPHAGPHRCPSGWVERPIGRGGGPRGFGRPRVDLLPKQRPPALDRQATGRFHVYGPRQGFRRVR